MASYRGYAESPVQVLPVPQTRTDLSITLRPPARKASAPLPKSTQLDQPLTFSPQFLSHPAPVSQSQPLIKPLGTPNRLDRRACRGPPHQRHAQMDASRPPSSGGGTTLRAGGLRSWLRSCGSPAGCEFPRRGLQKQRFVSFLVAVVLSCALRSAAADAPATFSSISSGCQKAAAGLSSFYYSHHFDNAV